VLAALALAAAAASASVPPAPARWVEDHADFLSPTARDALDGKLEAYQHETGHQVVVWIGRTLNGAPLDDWAVRTFAAWKVGRKGLDDGIAIFIFADDRAIDIEVGYGLEDKVPDAIASRIIREVMAPRLRAQDRDGAVTAGVDSVLAAIEGHAWAPSGAEARRWEGLGFGVLAVIVLILFLINPRLALWVLAMTIGRGGGGGGGFGGGGGRSGGGGARGGW
jgi:uncharacterized protein